MELAPVPRPLVPGVVTVSEQARAAEMLAEARRALAAGDSILARQRVEQIISSYPTTSSSPEALWLAAQLAFAQADYAQAAEHADRYVTLYPAGAAPTTVIELAERARAAVVERPTMVMALGAILPRTGSEILRGYGDLVLEGIRMAVDAHNHGRPVPVELVVLDDGGDVERVPQLIRELEGRQVFGVIGPLLGPGLWPAALARQDQNMVLISPTAAEPVVDIPNVYSMTAADPRGAERLAEYVVAAGLGRAAVMYPLTPENMIQAEAFSRSLRRAGGTLVADVPFEPGMTTFAEPLARLVALAPQSLFMPIGERDVRQLAPQLLFYGLSDVQLLGGEAWVSDQVLRMVDPRHLEGLVAATPLWEESPDAGWLDFVADYETLHRRSLDNAFPALGYDAASLLLLNLAPTLSTRAEFAAGVAATRELRGATGVIHVEEGQIIRRPFLVRVHGGEVVAAPPPWQLRREVQQLWGR